MTESPNCREPEEPGAPVARSTAMGAPGVGGDSGHFLRRARGLRAFGTLMPFDS